MEGLAAVAATNAGTAPPPHDEEGAVDATPVAATLAHADAEMDDDEDGGSSVGGGSVAGSVSGAAPRRSHQKGGSGVKKKKSLASWSSARNKAPKRPLGVLTAASAVLPIAEAASSNVALASPAAAHAHGEPAHKRARKALPNGAFIEDSDLPSSAALDGELSPAMLSLLGDLHWSPRFLQTVLLHLQQSRTLSPNWHVVAALFRQRLVEGSWSKDSHFLVRRVPGLLGGRPHLVRSRRQVSDLTPPVCERLFALLVSRDRGPEAAAELQNLMEQHKATETASRNLPFCSGGRLAPLPVPVEDVRLEFVGGLPRGSSSVVRPVAVVNELTGRSTNEPTAEEALEDATLDAWPGLTQNEDPACRLDGGAIRRWAIGHEVHVDAAVATTSSVNVPTSARAPLFSALTDLAHLQRRGLVDRAELVDRKPYLRNGLPLDLNTGEWLTGATPSVAMTHAAMAQQPTWTSPSDDVNLLDAILAWLETEPLPVPAIFAAAGAGSGSAALLPRTLAHWTAVRASCSGWVFPLAFYRRRWWLLCQEATEAPTDTQLRARGQPAAPVEQVPRNTALELVVQKVDAITQEVTRRMAGYVKRYGSLTPIAAPAVAPPAQAAPAVKQEPAAASTVPASPAAPVPLPPAPIAPPAEQPSAPHSQVAAAPAPVEVVVIE